MKHKFALDEDGEVDFFYADAYPYHYGPTCRRCWESWCIACEPDRTLDEECPGDEYEMVGQFDILTGEVIQ